MDSKVDWFIEEPREVREIGFDNNLESKLQNNYLIDNIKLLYRELYELIDSGKNQQRVEEIKTIINSAKQNTAVKAFLSVYNFEPDSFPKLLTLSKADPSLIKLFQEIVLKSLNSDNQAEETIKNSLEIIEFLTGFEIILPPDLDIADSLYTSINDQTVRNQKQDGIVSISPNFLIYNFRNSTDPVLLNFAKEFISRRRLSENLSVLLQPENLRGVNTIIENSDESQMLAQQVDQTITDFRVKNESEQVLANLIVKLWMYEDFKNDNQRVTYYQSIINQNLKEYNTTKEVILKYFPDFYNSTPDQISTQIFNFNNDISGLIQSNNAYGIDKLVKNICNSSIYYDKFISRLTDPITLDELYDQFSLIWLIVEQEIDTLLFNEDGSLKHHISDIRKIKRENLLNLDKIALYRLLTLKLYTNPEFIQQSTELLKINTIRYRESHDSPRVAQFQEILKSKILDIFAQKITQASEIKKIVPNKTETIRDWKNDKDYVSWEHQLEESQEVPKPGNYDVSDLEELILDNDLNTPRAGFLVWILKQYSVEALLGSEIGLFNAISNHFRITKINRQGRGINKSIKVFEISPAGQGVNHRILISYNGNKIRVHYIHHHDHGVNQDAQHLIKAINTDQLQSNSK